MLQYTQDGNDVKLEQLFEQRTPCRIKINSFTWPWLPSCLPEFLWLGSVFVPPEVSVAYVLTHAPHTDEHTQARTHIHACSCTYTRAHAHTRALTHIHGRSRTYTRAHAPTRSRTYTRAHASTRAPAPTCALPHLHALLHTHARASVFV